MELRRNLTPAILSYEGIQYRYMAPGVMETAHLDYLREHLRILSGFYGLLRPFDGVTPYRLEMQAQLKVDGCRDLYQFWGDRLARQLAAEADFVLNLASKEYSKAVEPHLPGSVRFVTCTFGEWKGGKVIEKGRWLGGRWCAGWQSIKSKTRRASGPLTSWATISMGNCPRKTTLYFSSSRGSASSERLQQSGGKGPVALFREMYAVVGHGDAPASGIGKAGRPEYPSY